MARDPREREQVKHSAGHFVERLGLALSLLLFACRSSNETGDPDPEREEVLQSAR